MASNIEFHHDESECSCPICFRTSTEALIKTCQDNDSTSIKAGTSNVEFVYSRTCGHILCLSCAEQILLSSSSYVERTHTMDELQAVGHLVTPTQRACPMCRAELSYFDLMKVLLVEKDDAKDSLAITKSEIPVAPSDPMPMQLRDVKFRSTDDSYVQFPSDVNNITTQGVTMYTNFFKEFVPTGIVELTGCKYLSKTHTFKARVGKIATMPDSQFTVWLTFSDSFQFIIHGAILKVDRTKYHDEIMGESYPKLRTEVKMFVCILSETERTMMRRVTPPKAPPAVPFTANTFWGNIFCQNFAVGFASFHFVKKPDVDGRDDGAIAYVSYDHYTTCIWPPLDDGQPLPSRLIFRNIQCPDEYTFRGSICWYDDYRTTWNGYSRWDYEMEFDTTLHCIRSGTVKGVIMNHDNERESETAQISKMFAFGTDAIYINAGACNPTIDTIAAILVHVPKFTQALVLASLSSRLGEMLSPVKVRLQTEGVTTPTILQVLCAIKRGVQNAITTSLERCQRDPSEPHDEMTVESPIDLDYYFE